jgi:hypothetical protein
MINLIINDYFQRKIVIVKGEIVNRNIHQKTKKSFSSSANSSGEIQKNKYLCKGARDAEKHRILDHEQELTLERRIQLEEREGKEHRQGET